jgi:hypothetical protein
MLETMAAPATTAAAPLVSIGANFEGSNISISGFFPPDSDGAVGPGQFVEMVNGVYRVYDKTGTILQNSSLNDFWSAAGVTPTNFAYDPRVLYDPVSQRWFASSAENPGVPNRILLAVSKTSDPTQGWQAVAVPLNFSNQFWADFPALGINQDGVYISAELVPFVDNFREGRIFIPKADLLQGAPTAAHASVFLDPQEPEIRQQPAVAFQSAGSEPFISAELTSSGQLKISSVDGVPTNPSVNTTDRVINVPPVPGPPFAGQKGTSVQVATGPVGPSFSSDVVLQGGKLFAVQGINQNNHAALRWFEIGTPLSNPVVLDSGVISPPGLDVYYGSIAVNPLGEVVIGFSGSGPNSFPSSYAVAGTLNGNVLQFGAPMLLKAGVAPDTSGRFGDYSTTTYDPNDPSHFWTIEEWTSAPSHWSTEISEINFGTATTAQTWFGGTGNFSDPQNWSPPGSPAATDTLIINAGTVRAIEQTLTNPNIDLGSSSSTPTLLLKDASLASTNHIRVGTTSFGVPQPEFEARISVVGRVTEDGGIDVGTTAMDVNQSFPSHLTIDMAKGSLFTMDPGAIWLAGDRSTIEVDAPDRKALFVNNGEIEALGGTVTMNVPVTGHGTFDSLFNNDETLAGTLDFKKSVDAGETVNLTAGLLKLDQSETFHGSIQGFNSESAIELTHARVTFAEFAHGVLTLFDKHEVEARLNIAGDFKSDQFAIRNEAGNAFITLLPSASA